MTARGHDMAGAIRLAHLLEICCRQYLLAQALGEPRHLTADEWAAFHARAGTTGYGR
jgi:L-fuculose-phosphate aldolase